MPIRGCTNKGASPRVKRMTAAIAHSRGARTTNALPEIRISSSLRTLRKFSGLHRGTILHQSTLNRPNKATLHESLVVEAHRPRPSCVAHAAGKIGFVQQITHRLGQRLAVARRHD